MQYNPTHPERDLEYFSEDSEGLELSLPQVLGMAGLALSVTTLAIVTQSINKEAATAIRHSPLLYLLAPAGALAGYAVGKVIDYARGRG